MYMTLTERFIIPTVLLALLYGAEKAHLITNKAQKVNDWPKMDKETLKEVRRKIDSGTNIHLD